MAFYVLLLSFSVCLRLVCYSFVVLPCASPLGLDSARAGSMAFQRIVFGEYFEENRRRSLQQQLRSKSLHFLEQLFTYIYIFLRLNVVCVCVCVSVCPLVRPQRLPTTAKNERTQTRERERGPNVKVVAQTQSAHVAEGAASGQRASCVVRNFELTKKRTRSSERAERG